MNILMLRHSAGFEHSYLPDAEVALKQICLENDWRITTSNLLKRVNVEALNDLDVLVFATTGNLAFSDEQKNAVISFVANGGGFVGIHNATDTGYDWPDYGAMIGGYFNGHPWTQEVAVIVEDPDHPATRMLEPRFTVYDEIYTFKNWARENTHVLMRLDNDSVDAAKGNRADADYALGWCHPYGEGRVIYTALGHPDELWHQDWFRDHIRGCIAWAAGIES